MKELVACADGFIGSHLIEMLVSKGYKVKVLSWIVKPNNLEQYKSDIYNI